MTLNVDVYLAFASTLVAEPSNSTFGASNRIFLFMYILTKYTCQCAPQLVDSLFVHEIEREMTCNSSIHSHHLLTCLVRRVHITENHLYADKVRYKYQWWIPLQSSKRWRGDLSLKNIASPPNSLLIYNKNSCLFHESTSLRSESPDPRFFTLTWRKK